MLKFFKFDIDKSFRSMLLITALGLMVLILAVISTLLIGSFPALKELGLKFVYGTTWNPVENNFGALPFIIGTVTTSFAALFISIPFSITLALLLSEYYPKGVIHSVGNSVIELLAGIPSIIYGFWGLFVFVPFFRVIETFLHVQSYGVGLAAASIILAVMIIPYSASIAHEVIRLVPKDLSEAAYALGATKYEVIKKIILPSVAPGIFAGFLLSLCRALGETMAVTMVIGNSNFIPKSLFDPANSMASLIANEFAEASGNVYLSSLVLIGFLLLLITAIINQVGKMIVRRFGVEI